MHRILRFILKEAVPPSLCNSTRKMQQAREHPAEPEKWRPTYFSSINAKP